MGSFKLRLVTYFLLLALLPLVAAYVGFSEVAQRGEVAAADARLSTAIRVAQEDFKERLEDAASTARDLASAAQVQRALAARDRSTLVRTARQVPHSAFLSSEGDLLAGEKEPRVTASAVALVTARAGKRLGTVVVYLPFDQTLGDKLAKKAALDEDDAFALVGGGQVIAPEELAGPIEVPENGPRYVGIRGETFRALGTPLVRADANRGQPAVMLLALEPKGGIDQSAGALRKRFLLFSIVAMLAVAILAYTLGRAIVRSLRELAEAAGAIARGRFDQRVPVRGRDEFAILGHAFNEMAVQLQQRHEELEAERRRFRDAIGRFGDALEATHEPYALLSVIVANTVAATGAAGGRIVVNEQEVARSGDTDAGESPLVVHLGPDAREGVLFLAPKADGFSQEARELAQQLGFQAAIALENARLHQLVERQANTDGLTELANRRQFEETLEGEISRAERFGGSLALVLADLDGFKQVNDRFGHQAGDDVLKSFADILRTTVRDIDLPARYGGEEFAVLLPQTDVEGARHLAERLRRGLAARPLTTQPGALVAITASFGVAAFPDAATAGGLFAAADEALYGAKRAGKNCVVSADVRGTVRAHD
jgi:diguanylate cyclase (GGDEF)-like protein